MEDNKMVKRGNPRPQEVWEHFKGTQYQIVCIAEHTESGEQLVVYQELGNKFKVYARPVKMFMSRVDKEKYPKAKQTYRFVRVQEGNRDGM